MKTTTHGAELIACTMLVLATGCSSYVQRPTASAGVPTLSVGPTNADVAPVALRPTLQATPAGAAASQAPLCAAAATCAALDAEQIPLDCVKKVPYTNVLVPKGTTFEVVDKKGNFTCVDSGTVVNGKEVLTCHGQELYAFQLKLNNPACGGQALAVGTGQCQDGFGYDAAGQCCAPASGDSAGETVVTVDLGACPLPRP
jgi:hypothetical protein